ncbi:GNAT family N-acetyltransferase [Trinickia violacea]|uniref:GNAT family N-acetyltransferase n=1 Tax=Trinickia violacea TaxID=2571746 RepID=A0A4P8INB1_9BURK|nr:GNAT family N-acetyltransferase [Trinickia violacea]QCP49367.1 GNAT family N-acetyltransferase [Trinickia violacea]
MNWATLTFDQLSARELYLILRARSAVFVVEASCVHLDADGFDEAALHVFAHEDMTRPMPILAYARIRPGEIEHQEVWIDKILTCPSLRGDGTAYALVDHVMHVVDARWPRHRVRAFAPAAQRPLYERFGFRRALETGAKCGTPLTAFVRGGPYGFAEPIEVHEVRRGRAESGCYAAAAGPFGTR